MAIFNKNCVISVFLPNGTHVSSLGDFVRINGFRSEISGGMGECVIEVSKKYDYNGSEFSEGNYIEIRIADRDTINQSLKITADTAQSRILYTGYISMIERDCERNVLRVHVLGHYTSLSNDILKNGSTIILNTNATTGIGTGTAEDADIGLVARGIIDRYRAETTNPIINYTTETIPLVGANMRYSFVQKTYREALEKVLNVSGAGYFLFVDRNNLVHLRKKSTTSDHSFIFKRHFTSVNIQRSIEKLRNFLLIYNSGTILKHYQDDDSIKVYGRRAEIFEDSGILTTGTADLIGARFIGEYKYPDVKVVCEIVDNNGDDNLGYDIDSLEVGQTCTFYGLDMSFSDILKENMVITGIEYNFDSAVLTIENVKSSLFDIQKEILRKVDELTTNGSPTSYS